jgi:sugar/nucleoside kinase (ribokinase family)
MIGDIDDDSPRSVLSHFDSSVHVRAVELVAAGAHSAVVTRDANCAEWADARGAGTQAAEPVVPRDSTGTGDAFTGIR